jgi:hypothetical protein
MEYSYSVYANLVYAGIIGMMILTSLIVVIYKLYKQKQISDLKVKNLKRKKLSINDTITLVAFFDQLLEVKFRYYLVSYIMANFVSDKELDKKDIKKLKEDFYTDVSATLNDVQKSRLLEVYSKKGIELYIHQTFLRLLNEANIKFREKGTGIDAVNKQTLNTIYDQG